MSRHRFIVALAFVLAVSGAGALALAGGQVSGAALPRVTLPSPAKDSARDASDSREKRTESSSDAERRAQNPGDGRTRTGAEQRPAAETERPPTAVERRLAQRRRLERQIRWRRSTAIGTANLGRLAQGVRLPREGVHFFTWDPVNWTSPNPASRRYGTDRLIRTILRVAEDHRRANPGAPRVAVGDLSRPEGGAFDASHGVLGEFGGHGTLGHVSHQNGLDVDIYYPRRDRREQGPSSVESIDIRLAQDLVDRFVAAGAEFVFVGPNTGLTGPPGIVQSAGRHDDHLHVRLPPAN